MFDNRRSTSSPTIMKAGTDTRFIATNLEGGRAKALYEKIYCRRGAAENHIKSWKTHLAADRTSCTKATANQFRLFLHAGAYWLMWSLRSMMPKRSLDLAGRAVRYAASAPDQDRRPGGRDENPDPAASADRLPLPAVSQARARPPAASRHLNAGASCPPPKIVPSTANTDCQSRPKYRLSKHDQIWDRAIKLVRLMPISSSHEFSRLSRLAPILD